MGLTDFLLNHGGGPGAIARRQARLYRRLAVEHPTAGYRDILGMMYAARAAAGAGLTGHKARVYSRSLPGDPESISKFRNSPNLSIRDLVYRIMDAENTSARVASVEMEMKIARIVDEALDAELPGWRKPSTLELR